MDVWMYGWMMDGWMDDGFQQHQNFQKQVHSGSDSIQGSGSDSTYCHFSALGPDWSGYHDEPTIGFSILYSNTDPSIQNRRITFQ